MTLTIAIFLATIVIITSIVATTEIYGYQIAVAADRREE